ncbi:MAG: ATP-binding cassette domain-containing protein [Acidimicrobiales bacterium]
MTRLARFRSSPLVVFFTTLRRAAPGLSTVWWVLVVLGGLAPVALALATGVLIRAVEAGEGLAAPLTVVGVVFVGFQMLGPAQQAVGASLGWRAASWMNDQLLAATTAPEGLAHLERPDLTDDLTMARDFDLGISGPPLYISMGFIDDGLGRLVAGVASALVLVAFAWWAPLVLGLGWGSTHWLLREAGVWKDRNTDVVRKAQRHADYAYRLAVDPPAAKEIRLFGLADWATDRFAAGRRRLYDLQWEATRMRERSMAGSVAIVTAANALVFWRLGAAALDGRLSLAAAVVVFQAAIGTSAIAFGGLSWALDSSAAPAAAVARLLPSIAEAGALAPAPNGRAGALAPASVPSGTVGGTASGAAEIRLRELTFAYPGASAPVIAGLDLTIPAGTSLAIVGQNGAGKTTLAKLLCRFYDPTGGSIEIDGVDLRQLDPAQWRRRVAAVFQDFVRYERTLRHNVAPGGDAPDEVIEAALAAAGAVDLAPLGTILAKGYPGGTELSGGQWQRVALARALCGVQLGAGLVLLDEPTAQLDVRGEAEIFRRLLAATRNCTTVLVSHRFSTVRLADRIAVVEGGRVVELGPHHELMALGGRYHTMYRLQAARFEGPAGPEPELDDRGEVVAHDAL